MARVTLEDGRIINFDGNPTQEDIDEVVSTLPPLKTRKTGSLSLLRPKELFGKARDIVREEFGGAAEEIKEAQQREERGEQGVARTTFTSLAQGAQAGLGSTFRGLLAAGSAVLPDFIEDPLRRKLGDTFEDFIQSETGQNLVKQMQNISEKIDTLDPKNRQLVRDIGDFAMTGVDLTTLGGAGKVAKKGITEVGEQAGKKGTEIIERSVREEIEGARNKLVDLIIDDTTPTKRAALSGRTTEGGFFSGRTVAPTALENKVVDELLQTSGIKTNRSALFNLNAINKAISNEAENLLSALKKDNFIVPKREAISRLSTRLDDLKVTDPDIIGDSENLAERIFAKMRVFIEDSDGTGLGLLNARQNFDRWVRIKRPKAFEKQDAYNTAVRAARNTVNDFLEQKATKTEVKKSLGRQSALSRAKDVLKVKSGREADTGFGRLLDRAMAVLGRKNQIVQVLATAAGIGGLGAAAAFAPAVAVAGGAIGVGLALLKLAKSPAGRKKLGEILLLIEKALPKAKGEEKVVLQELKDEIKALLDIDDIDVSTRKPAKEAKLTEKKDKLPDDIPPQLAEEARKYNTAEEFVDSNDLIFQGGKPGAKSTFFTPELKQAEGYANSRGIVDGEVRVIKWSELPERVTEGMTRDEYIRERGVVELSNALKEAKIEPKVVGSFPAKNTQSQLTDIFNRVNKQQ